MCCKTIKQYSIMKLELKHLAPYLPYGVRFNGLRKGWAYPDVNYTLCLADLAEDKYDYIKPILKPLKELTQDELRNEGFDSHVDYLTHELQNPKNKNRLDWQGKQLWRVEHAPYEMVEYLFKNHFDVFGLIDEGLAIDINTLQDANPN